MLLFFRVFVSPLVFSVTHHRRLDNMQVPRIEAAPRFVVRRSELLLLLYC